MNRERSRTPAALLAVLLVGLGLGLLPASAPAQAATVRTILITNGAVPSVFPATAGDQVRFRNTSAHTEFAVTGAFTTGTLRPGATSAPSAVPAARDYNYVVSTLGGLLPSGTGTVRVTAAPTTTPPAPPTTRPPTTPAAPPATTRPGTPVVPGPAAPTAAVPPAASPGAQPPVGPVAPAPVSTGGSGVALQPRLDTGSLLLPAPAPVPGGPDPLVAPEDGGFPTGDPGAVLGGSGTDGTDGSAGGTTTGTSQLSEQAGPLTDRLNDPATLRRYGLPAVIGLVLLGGAFSLVLRVLFATTSLREWLRGEVRLHRTA